MSLGDKLEMPLDASALGYQSARNLRLQVGQDRRSMRLVGELVRVRSGRTPTPPPALVVQGEMIEESPAGKPDDADDGHVATPVGREDDHGIVVLPALPADWVAAGPRTLQVAVQDGPTVVAKDMKVPCRVELTLRQRRCVLSATPIKGKDGNDQVRWIWRTVRRDQRELIMFGCEMEAGRAG